MNFVSSQIGSRLIDNIRRSESVWIVMAYFTPGSDTLDALGSVQNLQLVISDEFTINNPKKLRRLDSKADIRIVPTDADSGKLHAKVVVGEHADGSRWAIVGSANLTHSGLFANQEAGISFDSEHQEDTAIITEVLEWANEVHASGCTPDWGLATAAFERARGRKSRTPVASTSDSDNKHWIVKTTAGAHGRSYWPQFKAEQVLAIGWTVGRRDLSTMSVDEIRHQLSADGKDAKRAPSKILKFGHQIQPGDRVIICGGYPANSEADVHVYGVAEVEGDYYPDPTSSWWYHKIPVTIQVVEEALPKPAVTEALNRESLLETIHEITTEEFSSFCEVMHEKLGVPVWA